MTEDERLERLLRTPPARDARYQPVIAEFVDGPRGTESVLGSLRWGRDRAGFSGTLAFVVLMSAILAAAALVVVGAPRTDDLVVVPPPIPTVVSVDPTPDFPAAAVTAMLERYQAARWGETRLVTLDLAVTDADHVWLAASRSSLGTTATGEIWPGQTVVRPGAVSRIYLAATILRLADDGRLDLDDPIGRYVNSWPAMDGITIRNLLDGSSGIAPFGEPVEDLARLVADDPARTWTASDAVRLAMSKETRFLPGARHEPVDTEEVLMVSVIEAVTSQPVWDAFFDLFAASLFPTPIPGAPGRRSFVPTTPAFWDAAGAGNPVTVTDIPSDVLAVLGSAQDIAIPVVSHASVIGMLHGDRSPLSVASRALLGRSFVDGGVGGGATCPCIGETKDGVGWTGHVGPYTSIATYLPSKGMTIVLVANAAISDDELASLVDQVFELVGPAIP